jgi:hypothetical protein
MLADTCQRREPGAIDTPYIIAPGPAAHGNSTPHGMRRTHQDLAGAAGIHDAVTRAISRRTRDAGYSTASGGEVKQRESTSRPPSTPQLRLTRSDTCCGRMKILDDRRGLR